VSEELQKYGSDHPLSIVNIDKETLENMQKFQKNFLHKNPSANETKKNAQANDAEYLPISFIEMTLDEIFFGLWQTKNFKTEGIANEIVGSIELWYFHPVAKTWICRIGAGAVQVQMKSKEKGGDGDITNIRNKITNTLTKDYPHLKADCFRNAALSIGKTFGRDLNRKFEDQYNPVIKEVQTPDINTKKKELIDLIDKQPKEAQIILKRELRGYENENKLTVELLQELIGKLK
jgi:hypothetical protein